METFHVAIVGAGPAGLYAAQQLVKQGAEVVLFNRDIKPGGLAEYGIYPDKYKMKEGLRAQFEKILGLPQVEYFGNVVIGSHGALQAHELLELGFDAVLVTVGAQGTKWLGLPGEDLRGVYHAKDLVYHYNKLPPYSKGNFEIGKHVTVIGVGNVMMDMAHWLVRDLKIESMTAVARRGPAEVKFDKKEFETVGANVDLEALDKEIERCTPSMLAVDQSPEAAKAEILAGSTRALQPVSGTRILFSFLATPKEILGDANGNVCALQVENNKLVGTADDTKARGLGTFRDIPCDTVIFAIGDRVDAEFGLPIQEGEFVKSPMPHFPIDGISYEAYDPQIQENIPGIFLAGWARRASTGLVGVARKDGTQGATAIGEYLKTLPHPAPFNLEDVGARLESDHRVIITKSDLVKLREIERVEAKTRGLPEYKFATNQEMLEAIHKT